MAVLSVTLLGAANLAYAIITPGENALDELGQFTSPSSDVTLDWNKGCYNNGASPLGFYGPTDGALDSVNHRLFIMDYDNDRILVYSLNTSNQLINKTPVNVIGQTDYISCWGNNGQNGFWETEYPGGGVAFDSVNNRLFVVDTGNNRVLVFNTASITDGMNASYVLGQANFTNTGTATTQSGMNAPIDVAFDSTNELLYVADTGNERVLVYNVATGSIANGENASYVLGQTSFTASSTGTTASKFKSPEPYVGLQLTLDVADQMLYVGDAGNARVLVFNVAPGTLATGESASYVIGQSSFTTGTAATTQGGLGSVSGLAWDGTNSRLFVTDGGVNGNHRVMVYNIASLTNGENASDLLGEFNSPSVDTTPVYTKSCVNDGASPIGFNLYNNLGNAQGNPSSVIDSVNHRLFVSDSFNNRVLVFTLNSSNQLSSKTAANVLGQTDFVSCGYGITQSTMDAPSGLAFDSTNNLLYVADYGNGRVLVFNTASITNGMNASYELGEGDFISNVGSCTQSLMSRPVGVALDTVNHRLFASASGCNTVYVYNVSSLSNGMNASNVLGSATFTSVSGSVTQSTFNLPWSLSMDSANQILYVGDYGNARVLGFNTSSITNGMNATYVLGQANFTSNSNNLSQSGTGWIWGTALDTVNNRLFVTDAWNNRVMVYNTANNFPNSENASDILGEFANPANDTTPNFTKACVNNGASSIGFYNPAGLAMDSTNHWLFEADQQNNRVLVFPLTSGNVISSKTPSYVLGQSSFTTCTANLTQSGFNNPEGVVADPVNQRLFVGDTQNNRILVFSTASMSNGMNASYVLGQPNYTTNTANATQAGLNSPYQLAYDSTNTLLYVADGGNNRIIGYNVATGTIANGENASSVVGQTSYTSSSSGTTQTTLKFPVGVAFDSTNNRLFVSDAINSRVVDYAYSAFATNQNASDVLGQFASYSADTTNSFTKYCVNNGAGPLGFFVTSGLTIDSVNHRLFVMDNFNNRILVYTLNSSNQLTNKTPANVIGQTDFMGCGGWGTGSGQSGLALSNDPALSSMAFDSTNNRLFVLDANDNRVLVFNTSSISNGMNASYVLGQTNFTNTGSALTQSGLNVSGDYAGGLAYDSSSNLLYVGDTNNNRVMVFNVATGTIANGENASYVLGQSSYTTSAAATTQAGLSGPGGLAVDQTNHLLYVVDIGNNRVLTYNTSSLSNGMNASNVLGQSGFTTATANTTQSGFNFPFSLTFDSTNNRLFVGDFTNARIMVFNTSSITNGMNAAFVLGQANFTTGGSTNNPVQSNTSGSSGLAYDATNSLLYESESNGNSNLAFNRVMVWNAATGTIANGENASDLLGQYNSDTSTATVVYTQEGPNNGPTPLGLNNPGGAAIDTANHLLYLADTGNSRVLVYTLNSDNSIPTGSGGHSASYVLGQTSLEGANNGAATQSGLSNPTDLAFDSINNRLFVADTNSSRIMVFNTASLATGMNASYVLGQTNFTNNGSAHTQSTFSSPSGLAYDSANTRLFVADALNNRIMVFNVATGTIANGMNASFELGHASGGTAFTATTSGHSQSTLNHPDALAYDSANTRLFVADANNHRVMIWNVAVGTLANGENASNVLGQTSFTANAGACSQKGMNTVGGVAYDPVSSRLFTGDYSNDRVLIFDASTANIANGENASYVLGQANFTTCNANTSQSGLDVVNYLMWDSWLNRLFVADDYNNREMIFQGNGLFAGEGASNVIGQPDFVSGSTNTTQAGLNTPGELAYDPATGHLFVADWDNNRVTAYLAGPSTITNGKNAAAVLGQSGYTTATAATTQSGMNLPYGLAFDGTNNQLYVGDTLNNRVTLFATSGITNGENASDLLGQYTSSSSTSTVTYTQAGANNGPTGIGLYHPSDTAIDSVNHRMFVADSLNNRVLVYALDSGDRLPISAGGHTATYVLGQANMDGNAAATTQSGMTDPQGVAYDATNNRLFVADTNNARVLVFNVSSITNGMNASFVLGSGGSFTSASTGTTQSKFSSPDGVTYDATNGRLFVSDFGNSRILVFNVNPGTIANGMNASYVLGQANYTTGTPGTTQSTMNGPAGAAYDDANSRLFAADTQNSRVLVFNVAPGTIANGENASYVLGQSTFTASGTAITQNGFDYPENPSYDAANNRLFVADNFNQRVLVFNVAPATIANGENASGVLGQPDFNTEGVNLTQGGLTLDQVYNATTCARYDPSSSFLYVCDTDANRVLGFSTSGVGLVNGQLASYVLGQPNYTTGTANTTQAGLNLPSNLAYDSTNNVLYLADDNNNREMMFNVAPATIANGENATDMMGEYNSTSSTSTVVWTQSGNNNGPTALGFEEPMGVAMDTVHHYLYVSDTYNNRVLVYALTSGNAFPAGSGGHTASYVIGQTSLQGGDAFGTSQSLLTNPMGLAVDTANSRLFVADSGNHRIMVFSTASLSNGMNAINVLGQANYTTGTLAHTQAGLDQPMDVAYDSVNGRLFVADTGNNRIIMYNVAIGTIANGENASSVTGQSNFTNHTTGLTQKTLNSPTNIAYDSTNARLFVSDNSNHRVMVWSVAVGYANNTNAANVLGQTSFTAGTSACTQAGMQNPGGLAYDSKNARLYVNDNEGARVTMYNVGVGSIANGENAGAVLGYGGGYTTCSQQLGQSYMTMTSGTAGQTSDAEFDPTTNRLFVTDTGNNRVMIFNTANPGIPTNGEAASYVLGQADFVSNTCSTTQSNFCRPAVPIYDSANNLLYVNDGVGGNNNRVMIFNVAPSTIASGENASDLIGEYTSPSSTATVAWNQDGYNNGPTALGFALNSWNINGIALDTANHYLYVVDGMNNRIMVYTLNTDNSIPTGSGSHTASFALGQTSTFGQNSGYIGEYQYSLNQPMGIAYDPVNKRLFVADTNNARVMVFNTASGVTTGMNASYVLGEPDFNSANFVATQAGMSSPRDVALDTVNNLLYVADCIDNRVTVYNVAPGTIANGENASYVLGQSSFTTATAATTQAGMSCPNALAFDRVNLRLFVSQNGNNRVTVYNVNPSTIANGENASYVMGQSSFTAGGAGSGAAQMNNPIALSYDPNSSRLFVDEYSNYRLTVFNVAPSTMANGMSYSMAFLPGYGGGQTGVQYPVGVFYDPGSSRLFVDDLEGNRVMVFDGSFLSTWTPGYE